MRRFCLLIAAGIALFALAVLAQQTSGAGPYKVLKTAKVGGEGGFDYIYADADGRKLYIPRRGNPARVTVFNLDTLEPLGEIPNVSAAGAAVSTKSGHGFATSRPIAMWDAKTLMPIKTIDVQGGPDGILYDGFNDRIYILSHSAPNATVINAADGAVLGTIDLGGAPEQAATDGKGRIYVDIEDKGNIAVVDAKTMTVLNHYDLMGKGATCAGLALDAKNNILFAACRNPQTMVILSAADGKILETLPIGQGTDGAGFNPNTMEAFSSHGDGTLTVIKENSPTSFVVEQTVMTMPGAKTMTIDSKTGRIFVMAAEYAAPATPAAAPAPAPAGPGGPAGQAGPGGPGGRGGFGRGGGRGPTVPGSFTILEVGR
jgi:DNA-binding beta-propeller fold protein YncE